MEGVESSAMDVKISLSQREEGTKEAIMMLFGWGNLQSGSEEYNTASRHRTGKDSAVALINGGLYVKSDLNAGCTDFSSNAKVREIYDNNILPEGYIQNGEWYTFKRILDKRTENLQYQKIIVSNTTSGNVIFSSNWLPAGTTPKSWYDDEKDSYEPSGYYNRVYPYRNIICPAFLQEGDTAMVDNLTYNLMEVTDAEFTDTYGKTEDSFEPVMNDDGQVLRYENDFDTVYDLTLNGSANGYYGHELFSAAVNENNFTISNTKTFGDAKSATQNNVSLPSEDNSSGYAIVSGDTLFGNHFGEWNVEKDIPWSGYEKTVVDICMNFVDDSTPFIKLLGYGGTLSSGNLGGEQNVLAAASAYGGWYDVGIAIVNGGDYFKSLYKIPKGMNTTIHIGEECTLDAYKTDESGCRFNRNVNRIVFAHDFCGILVDIEPLTEIRPPKKNEIPANKILAYGTSITHGACSQVFSNTYISQLALRLGMDILDNGMGGSCFCEPEVANWIKDTECNLILLELSVNMIYGYTDEEYKERAGNIIKNALSTGKPQKS